MKRSYVRRLIDFTNEQDLLRECEKELQHCLDLFQVCSVYRLEQNMSSRCTQIRSHIATSVAIKRKDTIDEAFEEKISDVLVPVKNLLAQAVSETVVTLEVQFTF